VRAEQRTAGAMKEEEENPPRILLFLNIKEVNCMHLGIL